MMAGACAVCGRMGRDGQVFCTGCGGRLDAVPAAMTIDGAAVDGGRTAAISPDGDAAITFDATAPHVAGPVDRVTFQAEQARRRRRTWLLTAVCGVAAVLTGIPASLVFTPVVLALLLIVTKILDLTVGLPGDIWDVYERALFPLIRAIDEYTDESPASPPLTLLVHAALVWVVPGMLAMLLIWPALRALFLRGGGGGTLLALGARPPRGDDLEERQLVNVVEEMAIAAGLPPPAVMLIDAETANAAAIGTGPGDATVVVSRRLLDDLNRDETQGVLANLVASIGNGDLRIALSIISVYQTYALTYALLKAPFSPLARATLRRMARWTFAFWGHRGHTAEAEIVAEMLSRGMWDSDETDDFARATETPADAPTQGVSRYLVYVPVIFIGMVVLALISQAPLPFEVIVGVPVVIAAGLVLADLRFVLYAGGRAATWAVLIVSLPYYIGAFMSQFLLTFLAELVLGPLLALVWRTRRYLADATAVQLTRNPSGIAGGLLALQRSGGLLPGGRWAAPLFVVGQEVEQARVTAAVAAADATENQEMARAALGGLWQGNPAAAAAFAERMKAHEATRASFAGEPGSMVALNPSIARRLRRLRAMGAEVGGAEAQQGSRTFHPSRFMFGVFGMVLVAILIPIAFVLLLVAMALMAVFTLACGALMMAMVYGLLQLLR